MRARDLVPKNTAMWVAIAKNALVGMLAVYLEWRYFDLLIFTAFDIAIIVAMNLPVAWTAGGASRAGESISARWLRRALTLLIWATINLTCLPLLLFAFLFFASSNHQDLEQMARWLPSSGWYVILLLLASGAAAIPGYLNRYRNIPAPEPYTLLLLGGDRLVYLMAFLVGGGLFHMVWSATDQGEASDAAWRATIEAIVFLIAKTGFELYGKRPYDGRRNGTVAEESS